MNQALTARAWARSLRQRAVPLRLDSLRPTLAVLVIGLLLLTASCDKKSTEPLIPTGPTPAQRANVVVAAVSVINTERQSTGGYRYTVRIDLRETAGVSATVSAIEIGLGTSTGVFATARFDNPLANTNQVLAAYSSANSNQLLAIDNNASNAYATAIRVTVIFVDSNGNTGSSNGTGDVPALVVTPAPTPTPTPTPVPSPAPVPPAPAPQIASLSLTPATIQSQGRSTATITLTSAAPSGGTSVSLASSNTDVAKVPSVISVAAGQTSNAFSIDVSTVANSTAVTITATYGGVSKSALLTVTPPPPAPPPASSTGRLAFSSDANRGWSSIEVTVDGRSIGTITAYLDPGTPASCNAGSARVVNTVTSAAAHTWSARSNTGAAWSGIATVGANGCFETTLQCSNRDCSPPPSPTTQLPGLQCRTNTTGTTTVATTNRSSYTVRIDFEGPTRGSVTVEAGTTRTVRIDGGQYRITATAVNASNVRPATLTQTLSAGCDYVLNYAVAGT